MKQLIKLALLAAPFLVSCNNDGNESVDKADSANEANKDTALNNNQMAIDQASSEFLVRAANSGMAETELTALGQQKANAADIKSFAGMLFNDHAGVNSKVKSLASQKNIVLPDSITSEKRDMISGINKRSGKDFDKELLKELVKGHEASVDMFKKATTETKDMDVRAFADKTLPTLKMHLDSARALQKKYKY